MRRRPRLLLGALFVAGLRRRSLSDGLNGRGCSGFGVTTSRRSLDGGLGRRGCSGFGVTTTRRCGGRRSRSYRGGSRRFVAGLSGGRWRCRSLAVLSLVTVAASASCSSYWSGCYSGRATVAQVAEGIAEVKFRGRLAFDLDTASVVLVLNEDGASEWLSVVDLKKRANGIVGHV